MGSIKYRSIVRFITNYIIDVEKYIVIVWPMWIYRNNIVFRNFSPQPGYVINLTINFYKYMRYHNVISEIFDQDDSTGFIIIRNI